MQAERFSEYIKKTTQKLQVSRVTQQMEGNKHASLYIFLKKSEKYLSSSNFYVLIFFSHVFKDKAI